MRRELDINSIMKLLKGKMDLADFKIQFDNIQVTLVGFSQLFEDFKRQFDSQKSKQNKLLDVIRLIQRNYKKSLASSKVLNCLSCGRGDANFENQPMYVKGENNQFFINKLPNATNRNTRFRKPRGQSAFVVNHRINQMGQSVSTISRVHESARRKTSALSRPQTGVKKDLYYEKPVEVDYGIDYFNRNKAMEDHVKNRHQLGTVKRVKRGQSAHVKRTHHSESRKNHKKLPSLMGEHRANQEMLNYQQKSNAQLKNNITGNIIQGQIPKIEEEEKEWMRDSILESHPENNQTPNSKTQQSALTNDWNMNRFSEQTKPTDTPKTDNRA